MGRFLELAGKRFGKLTAVKRVDKTKHGKYKWLCVCDCGGEKVVCTNKLNRGLTRSCGCLHGVWKRRKDGSFYLLYRSYKKKATDRHYSFNLSETEFRAITSQDC